MDISGSQTAKLVALARAIGTKEKDSAIRNPDTLAFNFLDKKWRFALAPGIRRLVIAYYDHVCPGMYLYHQARTRHLDNLLSEYLLSHKPEQMVVLGAGLDSRAYRLAEKLRGIRVFEVDHPNTASHKQRQMANWRGPRDHVVYVPVDFTTDRLDECLNKSGFDFRKTTFFLWEGVMYYLPEAAVRETLGILAKAAPGSSLSFDYVLSDALTHPRQHFGAQKFIDLVERKGEPLRFGMKKETVAEFLRSYGYVLHSDLGTDQLQEKYLTMSNGQQRGKICDVFSIVHALHI